MPRPTPKLAAVLAALLAWPSPTASAAPPMPPSWGIDVQQPSQGRAPSRRAKRKTRAPRPWFKPRALLGVGLNIPELVPIEGYLLFGRHFGLRAFYTPSLPFNLRVEMPADVISSSRQGVSVANPDFNIRLKASYGAHYGIEALGFPMGGSFFIAAGVSHRRMRLSGEARSPILVCSSIEAQKEPPCPDAAARIQTDTELTIATDVETSALLTRFAVGWIWDIGSFGYLTLNAGATKPTKITRSIKVDANVDAPGDDSELTGALAAVKADREADLAAKALKEMRPVEEKLLPILGLSAGIRF